MRLRCFIFSILLFTGCFFVPGCKDGGGRNTDDIDNDGGDIEATRTEVSSDMELDESWFSNVLTEQEQLREQVENLSSKMRELRESGNYENRVQWMLDRIWKLIVIVGLVLAITALVYASKIGEVNKRIIKVINEIRATSRLPKSDVKGQQNCELQGLTGRVSIIEKKIDEIENNRGMIGEVEEIELPTSTTKFGYFGVPVSDNKGKGYFKRFDTARDYNTSMFSARIDGNYAEFEPLSIQMVRANDIDPAVLLMGEDRATAQEISLCTPGNAEFNAGRWMIIKKAEVHLK